MFPGSKIDRFGVFFWLGFQLQLLDATIQSRFYQRVTSCGLCITNHVNKINGLNQPSLIGKLDLFQPEKCLWNLILQILKSYQQRSSCEWDLLQKLIKTRWLFLTFFYWNDFFSYSSNIFFSSVNFTLDIHLTFNDHISQRKPAIKWGIPIIILLGLW